MSVRIDDTLFLNVSGAGLGYQDRAFSAEHIAAVLDGAGGGGTARTQMTATYSTPSVGPTVFYTGLGTDGSVITARDTAGVVFADGLWQYVQDTTQVTDFIAVWDEGDPDTYTSEWIVVDT